MDTNVRVPRPELSCLQHIRVADERLYLRFYLRSNQPQDQDIARARCVEYGVDYAAAIAEARRS